MSDSVILRSVKKFGEDNYGFESDRFCKWPFSLTVSYTKRGWSKSEQASELPRGRGRPTIIWRTITGCISYPQMDCSLQNPCNGMFENA